MRCSLPPPQDYFIRKATVCLHSFIPFCADSKAVGMVIKMKWASAFKYLSVNFASEIAQFHNQTQRVCFDTNLNGDRIRLRLSNRFAKQPLRMNRVTVGVVKEDAIENVTAVTLNGNALIELQPDQEIFSDEIPFTVRAGDRLAVSIYIGAEQGIESVCCVWSKTNCIVTISQDGDYTDGSAFADVPIEEVYSSENNDLLKVMCFFGFSALQVYTEDSIKVIAAFGDSITHMSCVTNAIAKRMYDAYPGQVTFINCGLGGNRLVHDATYIEEMHQVLHAFGEAGIKRFEKDVFEIDQVDTVLALIGINDIMHPLQHERKNETTLPEDVIAGYEYIASLTHAHNAKIFGATILPAWNDEYPKDWLPAFEKTRLSLNAWIRDNKTYDGYFDFEAVMLDPIRPIYLLPDVHIGDWLHPNDRGGQIIADTINFDCLIETI